MCLAVVLSCFSPAVFADARSAEVVSACASASLDLDCACVDETYRSVTKGFTAEEDDVAVTMIKSLMFIPGVKQDEQYMATLMRIMGQVQPFFGLTDSCKKMGGGADSASDAELSKITAICKKSDYFMDCDCVDYHYAKAAADYPKNAQEFLRATIGLRLGVETKPAYDDISSVVALQYLDAYTAIEDFRDVCSVPTPGGLAAARDVGETPAPTMEARADAAARDSMRMWCEAEDYESPAFCACRVQTLSEIVPERPFRFEAQGMKSLAAERLGRIKADMRYPTAAQAIGASPSDVTALRKESQKAFANKFEIAHVACKAAIRDLTAD
jgi:hypothetical protein